MANEFDPIEWLRTRDPLKHTPESVLDADETQRAIRDRVIATATSRRRRSRRLIPVAAAAAVLVASGTAVAAVLIARSSNPDPVNVLCFGEASLDASRVQVEQGRDPVAACREAWADPQYSEVFAQQQPPPLAVCVLESGVTAVFPEVQTDPCDALGLVAAGPPSSDDEALRRLTEEITEALDRGCVPTAEVERIARDALASKGLGDWTVTAASGPPSGLCGSIAIDAAGQVIRIVPIPPPPTTT